MTAQLDLFASTSAAFRAHAFDRAVRLAAVHPKDPVERALAVEAMCTARLAVDLCEFPPDQLSPTGLVFLGEARDMPLLLPAAPPRQNRK